VAGALRLARAGRGPYTPSRPDATTSKNRNRVVQNQFCKALHGRICAVCAEVCGHCAQDCDQFGDDAQMKACADACRRCADSCRRMATMAA